MSHVLFLSTRPEWLRRVLTRCGAVGLSAIWHGDDLAEVRLLWDGLEIEIKRPKSGPSVCAMPRDREGREVVS